MEPKTVVAALLVVFIVGALIGALNLSTSICPAM